MSAPEAQVAIAERRSARLPTILRGSWPWLVVLAIAILLPWHFFDWTKGRHSGFVLSLMSQMGLMIVFALSYNMQMGQAGLLSMWQRRRASGSRHLGPEIGFLKYERKYRADLQGWAGFGSKLPHRQMKFALPLGARSSLLSRILCSRRYSAWLALVATPPTAV
jgi:hypothetical protein